MAFGEIGNMNEVAATSAVFGIVIVAIDTELV